MKTMKRMLVLLLALAMAVAMLAIPAAAAEIEPRYPMPPFDCECGGQLEFNGQYNGMWRYVCSECGALYYIHA